MQRKYGNAPVSAKIVVPNSSVSSIIGKDGRLVQRLMAETGCIIQVSQRDSRMQERFLTIVGKQNVSEAVISICSTLQKDESLEQHLNLEYDLEIPIGSWLIDLQAKPSKPESALVHPDDAAVLKKGELLEYVLQAAPKDLLLRRKFTSTRSCGKSALLEAVGEIWECRGGQGPSRSKASVSQTSASVLPPGPVPPSDFVAAPHLDVARFQ
ncbi:unnamed protein product [Polarella glacialis]|uniref:K Homology domain-containing protein n=1 Tax=Polarella glacialis TaxID=89957 RepID=A0A813JL93_POLGL|nr:unnamed protein product [Polarella glacialis]CAE8677987.1 unnamed protein product [Polarella glacialis]